MHNNYSGINVVVVYGVSWKYSCIKTSQARNDCVHVHVHLCAQKVYTAKHV